VKLPRLDLMGRAWRWMDTVATGCNYPGCRNKVPAGGGHWLPDLDYRGCDDHPLPAHEVEAIRRELEDQAADLAGLPRNRARARRRGRAWGRRRRAPRGLP